jgi:AcrR family transcriptional regulator
MYDPAPESRRERKKRQLRTRIYDTACKLFAERGYDATTVEQIADAADIAPTTVFNHFASKSALLAEMAGEVFDHLQALLDDQLRQPVSAQERIAGFADRAAEDVAQARDLAHDVLVELMRTSARPGEPVPYLSRVHGPFTTIIREGQGKGQVRVDVDTTLLVEVVVGALNGAVINWINNPDYPLERRLREMAAFMGEAIKPSPMTPAAEREKR